MRIGRTLGVAPRVAALLLAVGGAAACRAQPAVAPVPCAPVAGTLPAGARADGLAGEYRLALVATQGPRAGRSVAGTLRLAGYAGPVQDAGGVRYPLHGSAAIGLDSVGALAPGDIGSADAARPGVRVIEWQRSAVAGRREITLRFGADANGAETGRIEGTHMALFVDSLSAGGFAGHWDSGADTRRSGGHFCAVRVTAAR